MYKIQYKERTDELWNIYGSFGRVNGTVEEKDSCIFAYGEEYYVSSEFSQDESGVISRKGRIKNISDHTINVNYLMSKFIFDGGEYEVYTQRNTWCNESAGSWQPLVSAISGETLGLRSSYGAAPFFALWNNQTGRGMAFHIVTKLPWRFEVKYEPTGHEHNFLEIEAGVNHCNFSPELASGEELELPEILYYEIRNKQDLDCYKLHHYMNRKYPRRELPVVYNTWFYKWEKITCENVAEQIKQAKELGVEYFVIDAGWFGDGEHSLSLRGDWFENTKTGFCGKMSEISELVRENGMKFGIWLEIETADKKSETLKNHRDYFITYDTTIQYWNTGNELYFYDFSNPEACEYMFRTISGLVEKYHLQYIKFDFNQDLKLDTHQNAFMDYFEGYDKLIHRLRAAFPDLYMEDCASGGLRMTLVQSMDFDSSWFSDNQSLYVGQRIIKDTLLRLQPQMMKRAVAIESLCDLKHTGSKILSTNDASWIDVRGVHPSYLEAFLTGGPICFSCDLNSWSEELFGQMQDFVTRFKEERSFWMNAVCRILTDTPSMLVLEYSDMEFEKAEILVYTDRVQQKNIVVYPKLDVTASYRIDGKDIISGAKLDAGGINVALNGNYKAKRITMERINK